MPRASKRKRPVASVTRENHPNKPSNRPVARPIISHVVDPKLGEQMAQALQLMKETDARSRVMFAKIHNLQQDIATLQSKLLSVVRLLVVRDNPDEIRENEAVIKQFILDYGSTGQSGSIRDSS